MSYVSTDDLIGPGLPEEDFDVPGIGTIRIRALSLAQAGILSGCHGDEQKLSHYLLHFGVVNPKLSRAQAKTLLESRRAGDLDGLGEAILQLSGMGKGATDKATFPGDGS
jgi:hypothetical protein